MGASYEEREQEAPREPMNDGASFEALYDEHAPSMLALANRILGSRSDAEDLVHDVFIEAWRNAKQYDSTRGTIRAWLMVRIRTRAIDRLRYLQMAQRKGLELSRADDSVSAPNPDASRARTAVQLLTPTQRSVIELGYFEGLTCREIAERCDVPIGTVKSRLAAALGKLRERFAEGGPADEVRP